MTTNYFFTPDTYYNFVTKAKAKKQLRVEASFEEEDDVIQDYIDAAEKSAEDYLNKKLKTGKLIFELDAFPSTNFIFSQNDENDTVEKIEYYADGAETLTALEATNYKLRKGTSIGTKEIKFINDTPATSKRDDAVIITIKQGFLATDLPKPIYQAILLRITSLYEVRNEVGEIGYNSSFTNLLRPYRNF